MKIIALAITLGLLSSGYFDAFCQNDTIQTAFSTGVLQPYFRNNSLYKEKVYVHFNKSCYLPGDDIWFKTYVTDPLTSLLNIYTKNLYVELYDQKGKLVEQKILSVNAGVADNLIKLDERILPGKYTFRVYTNWMKNFYATEEFDTPLTIVGDEKPQNVVNEIQYDVQFFPESGPLLEGLFNRIAVKVLDPNGKSVQLSGLITGSNNDSIASFKLNQMGMGEFVLNPLTGATYKAIIALPDGKEQIVAFPAAESKGVIASVNTFLKNRIVAEVKSNTETIGSERLLYILIHNNGNIYKTLITKLSPDQPVISFSFDRSEAGNGVNCLTVFDENFQPVAERLFFNNKTNIKGKVDIRQTLVNDSVQFELSVANDSVKHLFSSLSLSVLPERTVSNKFNNSLLADILLKSGVKGDIENPNYYFEKDDLEHLRAMDLLLLTQGWRKYDWKELLVKNKKLAYEFEKGFTITGTVKNWMSGKEDKSGRVSLLSPENKLFRIISVDSTGHFLIPGLFLTDSTKVLVSASSSKGKNWNRTILASVEPYHTVDSTIAVKPFVSYKVEVAEIPEPPLKLLPGVIQLPEFTVTAERILPFEGSVYVSLFDKSVEITKENYSRYTSLEKLLLLDFNVHLTVDPEGNYYLDMGRGKKNAKPKLIIDDIEAPDLNYLSYFTIEQIEAVSVNKEGNAILGDGGGLIIKTRKTPINWGSSTSPNLKHLLFKGFAPAVEYYSPKYLQKPESEDYQKYAAIFWKADIIADSTGVASFRFTVPKELNTVNVRTEGISDDGTIYLDERKVVIKRED